MTQDRALQATRLRRAKEIVREHDQVLCYMGAECPMMEDGEPDWALNAMDRYLVLTDTDGGEDGWCDFYATIEEVLAAVRDLVWDEWGLRAVHDLDEEEWMHPLDIAVTVRVTPLLAADAA